jgi:TRAP-type transport system small permease protein
VSTGPVDSAGRRPGGPQRIYEAVGGFLVLAIAGITAVDVFGRYVLSRPVKGAFEIIEVLMALSIFWFLPLLSLEGSHISVSLLRDRPGSAIDRLRRVILEVLALVGTSVLAVQLGRAAAEATQQAEASLVLGLPKGPVLAVCAVLAAAMSAMHLLRATRRGSKAETA